MVADLAVGIVAQVEVYDFQGAIDQARGQVAGKESAARYRHDQVEGPGSEGRFHPGHQLVEGNALGIGLVGGIHERDYTPAGARSDRGTTIG